MNLWAKLTLAAAMFVAGAATAQTNEAVAQKNDWGVFTQGQGADRMCWIVSQPVSSRYTRSGKPVAVNRGDAYLMVAIRPGQRVKNEVSMITGFTYRKDSSVKMKIGNRTYEMFTEGDAAWTDSAESDDALVDAMRRGADAVATGVSSRGTTAQDKFSLRGFTAALQEARKLCN